MTRIRHLEITVEPFKPGTDTPDIPAKFVINPFVSARIQPQTFIKFQVEKQVSSEPNGAFLEMYNLSDEHSSALDFKFDAYFRNFGPQVTIKGGFLGDGIRQMFTGVVVDALTTFEAPNYVTRINVRNILYKLLKKRITYQAVAGSLKSDAILAIIRQSGGELDAGQATILRDILGSSKYDEDEELSGTLGSFLTILVRGLPRRLITQWDDAGVSFNPLGVPTQGRETKVISEISGLIGVPKATAKGLEFETRLDPTIRINDPVVVVSNATARLKSAAQRTVESVGEAGSLGVVFSGTTSVNKVIHSGDNREGDFKTGITTNFIDIIQQAIGNKGA